MSDYEVDRRTFLKLMGVTGSGVFLTLSGCDRGVSLEDGKEIVTSYLDPEEFVIPGDEVWYASTCLQCPAGCGLHARVREGRVRKLEGNPDSPVNLGRLCPMGQAGLQRHYHPDRLSQPLARNGDRLETISWHTADQQLRQYVTDAQARQGEGFALLSGDVNGHLAPLLGSFIQGLGSAAQHYAYEPLNDAVSRHVHRQMLGVEAPRLHLEQARLVVSFGADFLGPWRSPVQFAAQYATFRQQSPRGTLIQVEPKMTLTGANADWWLPLRPGSEGWLMLGVARLLSEDPSLAAALSPAQRQSLERYDPESVSQVTGVTVAYIERLTKALRTHRPSLVLVGGPAEGGEQGGQHVAAGLLLNQLLGNIGTTLTAAAEPCSELRGLAGNSARLRALTENLASLDTLFMFGSNPVYSAPGSLGFAEALQQVPHKVVFCEQPDETAMAADLVIPVRSSLEDWGTRIPAYSPEPGMLQFQQPVMRPLHPQQPGTGDLFLRFVKQLDDRFEQWDDFYAYLHHNVIQLREAVEAEGDPVYDLPPLLQPPSLQPPTPRQALSEEELDRLFWEAVVARGQLKLPTLAASLQLDLAPITLQTPADDTDYPFHLIPSPRLGLYDGRHANLPWLQEVPDQLTTVVWDSWAEIHPETADALGVSEGDELDISSAHGSLRVKVVVFPGIHPEAIAVPLGQGHSVGRYAKGIGVNPFTILAPSFEPASGELALYATRVKVRSTGQHETVVKLAPTDSQHKRRLVRTVPANLEKNNPET